MSRRNTTESHKRNFIFQTQLKKSIMPNYTNQNMYILTYRTKMSTILTVLRMYNNSNDYYYNMNLLMM